MNQIRRISTLRRLLSWIDCFGKLDHNSFVLYKHNVLEIDNFPERAINIMMNPESVYRHIGAVIRRGRRKFKPRLTQAVLAQRVGISRASLANIETGRQSVLVHQLYALAAALDLKPADFLLPAAETSARSEWDQVLPHDLKPLQKNQIARLLADMQAEPRNVEEDSRAKPTKR
jgi:transcriptional regulator with XRE-family HTH domain